jgi:hypothetical protein
MIRRGGRLLGAVCALTLAAQSVAANSPYLGVYRLGTATVETNVLGQFPPTPRQAINVAEVDVHTNGNFVLNASGYTMSITGRVTSTGAIVVTFSRMVVYGQVSGHHFHLHVSVKPVPRLTHNYIFDLVLK